MIEWEVYYADGSTFSNRDGEPEEAPGLGVLCIAQHDQETGRRELTHGTGVYVVEWYWWLGGQWLGGNDAGLVQYLASPGWKKVLVGVIAPNDVWRATVRRAIHDHLEGDEEAFMVQ